MLFSKRIELVEQFENWRHEVVGMPNDINHGSSSISSCDPFNVITFLDSKGWLKQTNDR